MAKPKDSSIEKKKWYQNTKAIIGLVTGLVAAVVALNQLWQLISKPAVPTKAQNNTLVVFDRSAAMAEPFDGSTKFEVAKNALLKKSLIKVAKNDNLALRLFGGPCFEDGSSKLAVPFGQDNKKKVEKKLTKIKEKDLKGETTLVSAVIDATGDFNPPEIFEGVKKNIIVIAGGFDSCPAASVQDIRDRLTGASPNETIEMDIQIIGMRVPRDEQAPFTEIADSTGGQAFFVNTREELDLLFEKPALANLFFEAKRHYNLTEDEKAEPLFQKAAAEDVSEAMLYLGKMYSDSLGVLKDHKKAIDWYLKAANAENAEAMTLLGVMYYYGYGVKPDSAKAVSWFSKGAEAENAEAMYNLGGLYEYGRGVEKRDLEKAAYWYRKAASLGHQEAKNRLVELGGTP